MNAVWSHLKSSVHHNFSGTVKQFNSGYQIHEPGVSEPAGGLHPKMLQKRQVAPQQQCLREGGRPLACARASPSISLLLLQCFPEGIMLQRRASF